MATRFVVFSIVDRDERRNRGEGTLPDPSELSIVFPYLVTYRLREAIMQHGALEMLNQYGGQTA